MDLSKYKNALGEPGKGIHSYRFLNLAIMDVIMTLVGAAAISFFFKTTFWKTALVLFLLGIVLHHLFSVRTTLDKLIFK